MADLGELSIPIIDVSPLADTDAEHSVKQAVADEIGAACRGVGFFCISNCEALVPNSLRQSLLRQAREVSTLPQRFLYMAQCLTWTSAVL